MMKAYMLTLCALALPASAAAADTTLNEINARLERLEAELKQSRIQLQDATRKIDRAEKRAASAEQNAARAQERLQAVEHRTDQDLALIKKPAGAECRRAGEASGNHLRRLRAQRHINKQGHNQYRRAFPDACGQHRGERRSPWQ
ncbi:Uncharacterised protein [Klebsiella oxytoca]|nr:Uncharacterised protein [Klebsiella oxytoca]